MALIQEIVWCVEAILSLIFNFGGVYLLVTEPKIKVSQLLLLHLSATEIMSICKDLVAGYYIFVLNTYPSFWFRSLTSPIFIAQMLSVIWITIDRVMVVYLGLKYKSQITKKRVCLALVCGWVVCYAHSFLIYYGPKLIHRQICLAWEFLVLLVVTSSYKYIFKYIPIKRSRTLKTLYSTVSKRRLNVKVPFFIVIVFSLFVFLPSLLLNFFTVDYSTLAAVVYIHYLINPVVYVFGSHKIRHRLQKFWCHGKQKQRMKSFSSMTSIGSRKNSQNRMEYQRKTSKGQLENSRKLSQTCRSESQRKASQASQAPTDDNHLLIKQINMSDFNERDTLFEITRSYELDIVTRSSQVIVLKEDSSEIQPRKLSFQPTKCRVTKERCRKLSLQIQPYLERTISHVWLRT